MADDTDELTPDEREPITGLDPDAPDPYDPVAHNVGEVQKYLDGASVDEVIRVQDAERHRTDGKTPRKGIVEFGQAKGVVGPDGYTRVIISS